MLKMHERLIFPLGERGLCSFRCQDPLWEIPLLDICFRPSVKVTVVSSISDIGPGAILSFLIPKYDLTFSDRLLVNTL